MFKHCILVFVFLSLVSHGSVQAQSYNYIRYTQRDGLASSTVYSMLQDKQGFMWFGTETGLSRFDGTNFKTYTTKDGLPENEILKMYEDSKGRIWLLPFRNAICYYYKGKIYNQQNDSILAKINIKDRILNLFETKDGDILMCESDRYFSIENDRNVSVSNQIGQIRLKSMLLFEKDEEGRIWFSSDNGHNNIIYRYFQNKVTAFSDCASKSYQNSFSFTGSIKMWMNKENDLELYSEKLHSRDTLRNINYVFYKIFSINDSLISICSSTGAIVYNLRSHQTEKLLTEQLPASNMKIDAEGSIWVSTVGFGIFRFPDKNFQNIDSDSGIPLNEATYTIDTSGQSLVLGFDNCRIATYNSTSLKPEKNITIYPSIPFAKVMKVTGIVNIERDRILVTTYDVIKTDADFREKKALKTLFPKQYFYQDNDLYLATTTNLIRLDAEKFRIVDTIWTGRTTSVYLAGDSIFIGTLKGLYLDYRGKRKYLGDLVPFLKSRISAVVKSDDNSIWVTSYDNGLLQIKNGTIYRHFSVENGLPSNICRAIAFDHESVWVGTDKGIARILYTDKDYPVTSISKSDGLGSDFINKIFIYGDTVFVATSDGVSYFTKKNLSQYSECRLNILDVYNGESVLPESNNYILENNRLKISFVGISFKSAGNILYRYRLKGIDDEWKTTRETTLEFVSLPYGDYELEIIAENKFGVVSNKVSLLLHVPIPFWKSAWFYSLLIVLSGTIIYILYKRRLQKIQSEEEAKTAFNKKIAEMEMKALRAQMNPHFTFNVLNSIQYFIGYNDTIAAQRYLSRFSKLIRMTLDNSKNVFIPLADEVSLLELYLGLEKMRFEEKFNYRISVEGEISRDRTLVPNMLVQPFIENAVKHGFKEGVKNAEIEVSFYETGNQVICTITDNGIGRIRAAAMQNASGEQHKSAGLSMIKDKVEALAYYYNYQISVEVADLALEAGKTIGTKVIIKMPKKISDK